MIGNFEIQRTDVTTNCLLVNNFTYFKSVYLTVDSFEFSNSSELQDINTWKTAINNKEIIPLLQAKGVDFLTEDTLYHPSKQDYEYLSRDGKYRFLIRYLYDAAYHALVDKYSGQDLKVIFVDWNNNLYATNPETTKITGFNTDLVHLKKMKIGDVTSASWSVLRIDLSDAKEFSQNGITTATTFNLNSIISVITEIQNLLTPTPTQMTWDVVSEGQGVEGLTAFTIDDDDTLTRTGTLNEFGGGSYEFNLITPNLTTGKLILNEDIYFDEETYATSVTPITIFNISIILDTQINFSVETTGGSAPVTGLLASEIDLTDNFNGTLTIGTLSEPTSGDYEATLVSPNLTDGNIDINTALWTGSNTYIKSSVAFAAINSGGTGATDWINPTSGIAQDWTKEFGAATYSIVTGNGFVGNAQRAERNQPTGGSLSCGFRQTKAYPDRSNVDYSFKYRSNVLVNGSPSGSIFAVFAVIVDGGATNFITLPHNTGTATLQTGTFSGITGDIQGVVFFISGAALGVPASSFIEADEINLVTYN